MDKRPQLLAKNKIDLMPNNASCKRWDTPQCYPGQPGCTVARHLITLAALISGIVGSKSTQLPHIAAKVPNGTKPESRVLYP